MTKVIPGYGILVAPSGRKYLDKNIGTDILTPFGKYYTFDEAKRSCPSGTRLPTWDEVEEDIEWFTKILPFGASGSGGGKVGWVGYYWSGEDENVFPGSAIFFSVKVNGETLIQVNEKDSLYLVRCVVM